MALPAASLYDGAGNRMLQNALRDHLRKDIEIREIDAHINDPRFVDACVDKLVAFMEKPDQNRLGGKP